VEYREHGPSAPLASFVQCVWTLEGNATELGDEVQPILPDGRPELVVHFGDAFERVHPNGAIERQPALLFAGQLTGPLVLRPTGHVAVLGVRLHPDGAAALLSEPQSQLVGLTIGVDVLSGSLFQSLAEARDSATSLAEAVRAVQDRLVVRADRSRVDARVRYAVAAIYRDRGRISMKELARRVGVTRRHLERQFKKLVGVSPKRLARIARFQHAVRVLEGVDGRRTGADTAAMCGYADQAHFVREYRELTGQPPRAHLVQRAQLTGFFMD